MLEPGTSKAAGYVKERDICLRFLLTITIIMIIHGRWRFSMNIVEEEKNFIIHPPTTSSYKRINIL